jgi:hypothetical protein
VPTLLLCVHISGKSGIGENPPNPLKKLAQIRILVPLSCLAFMVGKPDQREPLFKGDLAVRYGRGSPAHKSATRQGDSDLETKSIRLVYTG